MNIDKWWQQAEPRARDKLVDTAVFGHTPLYDGPAFGWICTSCDSSGGSMKSYSQHLANAWLVVAKLRESELFLLLNDTMVQYRAVFFTIDDIPWDKFVSSPNNERWAWQDTAESAICLAALKAIGITEVE